MSNGPNQPPSFGEDNPYLSPIGVDPQQPRVHGAPMQPQGGLSLGLGITGVVLAMFGWLACVIIPVFALCFSVPAIFIAKSNLNRINHGAMDPNARGLETAGLVLGIIGTVLGMLALMIMLFFLVVVVGLFAGAAV